MTHGFTYPTRFGAGRDVRLLLIAVFAIALQPFLGFAVTAALANLEAVRRFVAGWQAREPSGVVRGVAAKSGRSGG